MEAVGSHDNIIKVSHLLRLRLKYEKKENGVE